MTLDARCRSTSTSETRRILWSVSWRRLGIAASCVIVVWLMLLVVLGSIYGEEKAQAIADRIGETLQAPGTIEDHDLALVRGRLTLEHLRVKREDAIGKLSLDVGEVRCELAPLGIALADSSCRELAIENVKLELSTFALFKLRVPRRPPIRARAVVIDHAVMVFEPSARVASLGKIRLVIDHAEAGSTLFKTPLSWVFHLETLRATLELSFGTIKLSYSDGILTASGSLFGRQPVVLPFQIPLADLADDPARELKRLVELGRKLAEDLVAQKTRQWLNSKLP